MRELLIYYLLFVVVVALAVAALVSRLKIKRPLRFIFIMMLLIASPVILSYLTMNFSSLPEVTVPDLIGLSESEARVRVEAEGLKLQVESAYEENSDMVTFQRPEPGRTVKMGRPVFVILGKPQVMPLTHSATPEPSPEIPKEEPIW
ncbi:PASTA domain-containing protein [Candidatus Saganbacteria bacterium]|nr:PASTA domain-containing protein [Candidatus Saganbacteria bacterium]